MNDRWREREGGIWVPGSPVPGTLISELYDRQLDEFQRIWQRDTDGHYQAEFLIKEGHVPDSQWSLPFWLDIADGGIFESQSAAAAHLATIADERRASGQSRQETRTITDELTGLSTGRQLSPSAFDGQTLSLFVDIDGMIWLNDKYGHEAGDRAIVMIVDAIVRQAGTVKEAATYRIGGDEFLVVLPGSSPDAALELARAIVDEVQGMRIAYARRDQPSRTTLDVNAVAIRLTAAAFARYFGRCGITDEFQDLLWRAIDAKRQEMGTQAGVVATLDGLGISD